MYRWLSRLALIGIPLFLVVVHARPSQEGAMPLASFTLQSNGVDSGPVSVSGSQDATGVTALTVKAFGKNYALTRAHLQQLRGTIVNGIQLSGEGGYPELGGRTIYLQLTMGWTSGIHSGKLITIKERGDITIEAAKAK